MLLFGLCKKKFANRHFNFFLVIHNRIIFRGKRNWNSACNGKWFSSTNMLISMAISIWIYIYIFTLPVMTPHVIYHNSIQIIKKTCIDIYYQLQNWQISYFPGSKSLMSHSSTESSQHFGFTVLQFLEVFFFFSLLQHESFGQTTGHISWREPHKAGNVFLGRCMSNYRWST